MSSADVTRRAQDGTPQDRAQEAADVVVVGGGVMGASIAFHLAEAGADVVLLERDSLGSGSTSKAAGGVRAQFSDEVNIRLGQRSLEAFAQFGQRPGQEIDLHRVGYLFLLSRQEDVETFEQSVELQNSLGVPSRMLTVEEVLQLSPWVAPEGLLAAAWSPEDGHCSPESVVLGYASGARRYGARIRTGVEVTGIDVRGGTVTAVETNAGRVATGTVVCAAGAWSQAVGAMAGVDLPVTPYRRQVAVTEPISDLPDALPMTIDFATSFYFHREGQGLLMGISDPAEPPSFSTSLDERFLDQLAEAAAKRAPRVLDVGVAHRWAGLYEVTPDHNALVGEAAEVSRFLYATGFSGHGFLQGPAVGEVIRDLVLNRDPVIDVSSLDVRRFAHGRERPEANVV